jgi:phosphoribosylformimino-5-aminoimidazole carboxamide ribotide isomerase
MLIIPAIDLIDGQCVRLRQGDYAEVTAYDLDPVELARTFAEQGATWLHLVDLDGAKAGKPQPMNLGVLRRIYEAGLNLSLEYGGGIRTELDLTMTVAAGANRVVLGSMLTKSPELARACFKLGDAVVAGIDARNGRVAVEGWTEDSELDALDLAREFEAAGAKRFIVTDIATDGMLQGPNLEMLRQFAEGLQGGVIASGGVATLQDLKDINAIEGIEGAIVGKAIYERRFTVAEAVQSVR